MSRLVRAGLAAGLLTAALGGTTASAAPPCTVTFERGYSGGPNWTAVYMYPVVTCA